MSTIVPLLGNNGKREDSDDLNSPRLSSSSEGPWETLDTGEKLEKFGKRTIKKVKTMVSDFRNFIDQGNIIDLSIGIVLGASFSVESQFISVVFILSMNLMVNFKTE